MRKTLEVRKTETEKAIERMLTKRSLFRRKESCLLLRKGKVVEEERAAEKEETEIREERKN